MLGTRPAKKWQIRTIFGLSEDAWKIVSPIIRITGTASHKYDFYKVDQCNYRIVLEKKQDVEAVLTATSPTELRNSRQDLSHFIKT